MPGEQIDRAIALIKSGQREPAREILIKLVRADPHDTTAWLWLAETMPDDSRRIAVLDACLKLNPQSQMVKHGLARIREHQASADKATGETEQTALDQAPFIPEILPLDFTQVDQFDQAEASITPSQQPVEEFRADFKMDFRSKETVARKATTQQHRQNNCSNVLLVLLGLFTVVVVGITAYVMQDELRALFGLPGARAVPVANTSMQLTQTAYARLQITPTPLELIPTPTPSPEATPTATLAFTFSYPVIAPENGSQVAQVGELSTLPAQCLAISPDNRLLAAGVNDSTVVVWNLLVGNIVQQLKGHTGTVNALAFSPDSLFLVSGSEDGTLRIWDMNAGMLFGTLTGDNKAVHSVAFSPDGHTIASGSSGGIISIWQLGVDTAIYSLPAGNPVLSLDFTRDGSLLASGLDNGDIQVWDVGTGNLWMTFKAASVAVNSIKFHTRSHLLAAGSADESVKLWDVDNKKILYTIGTHNEAVSSLSFSPDGRVLASASIDQTIKLWDMVNRREINNLRNSRNMPAIAFSPDGRVLAAALSPTSTASRDGGVALWGITDKPEVTLAPELLTLDALERGNWVSGARLVIPRAAHQAVPVSGEGVLIIGGGLPDDPASFTSKAEIYNLTYNSTLFTGAMNVDRGSFSATVLGDGRVLVVGGNNASQAWLPGAEIYNPVYGTWTFADPLDSHGVGHTATLLKDGRVLVAGGCVGDGPAGYSSRVELFDPGTNSWSETGSMSQPRCNHNAVLLVDGRVLVAGGEAGDGSINSAEIYNPITGQWTKTGSLNTARSQAEAVRLSDGRVMVTGGLIKNSEAEHTLSTVEIYDIGSGTWVNAAPVAHARYGHTANLLPGGFVLVAGGLEGVEADPDMFLRDVEVYNPGADSWIEISPLTVPRAFHTTILLPDGHIFVAGGLKQVGSVLASTEFLLPAPPIVDTPTWTVKNTPTIENTPGTETTPGTKTTPGTHTTPTGTVEVTVTPTPTKP